MGQVVSRRRVRGFVGCEVWEVDSGQDWAGKVRGDGGSEEERYGAGRVRKRYMGRGE